MSKYHVVIDTNAIVKRYNSSEEHRALVEQIFRQRRRLTRRR
jgi:hypothetical protein